MVPVHQATTQAEIIVFERAQINKQSIAMALARAVTIQAAIIVYKVGKGQALFAILLWRNEIFDQRRVAKP
jgi:hypothetical protein